MKKLFLIPIMALFTCVMAWGSEIKITTVYNFADLKTALSSEGTADVVKLGQDIAYPSNGGSELLDIQRSLTLDGNGYKLSGYAVRGAHTGQGNNGQYNKVTLVVNHQAAHSGLVVTLKDLAVEAGHVNYPVGVFTYDGIDSLAIVGCTLTQPSGSNGTTILYYGESSTPLKLFIQNSTLSAKQASGSGGYGMEVLKPIKAIFENSTFEGFCSMTFKYPLGLTPSNRWCIGLGTANIGARGTTIKATNCQFLAPNVTNGISNSFGTFVCEEDGITLDLINCGMNAQKLGTALQKMFYASDYTPETRRSTPLRMTISGDNSHINGNFVDNRYWVPASKADALTSVTTPITNGTEVSITITGGTYSVDPRDVKIYHDVTSVSNGAPAAGSPYWTIGIDADKYEVKTVTMDGVATPLYRVVKKAEEKSPGVKYDLNDDVPSDPVEGAGDNPNSSFELSTGTEMTLNQETTTAGYVEVKDNATEGATTVTVGKATQDQTLIINNGLDVQGDSKVEVQSGSALIIGEGGIVTSKPENIVIKADENGAASLLLEPTIKVNQTPKLTVKMTAKQIGRDNKGDFYWHRFACPVADIASYGWTKECALGSGAGYTFPTYLYAWDYNNDDWKSIVVADMVPLQGYTLTLASNWMNPDGTTAASETTTANGLHTLQDVTYTFQGKLIGNTNQKLDFTMEGYNFFGNSYTGYMHVLTLLEGLVNNEIEGTAYMWCNDPYDEDYQSYVGVSLYELSHETQQRPLKDWKKEVAPLKTFILRLRGADNVDEEINYASAIWGNPRYGNNTPAQTPAPRRRLAATSQEESYMEIVVKGLNSRGSKVRCTQLAGTTDAFESGFDVVKYMNKDRANLYAAVQGEELSAVVTDNLEGKMLNLQTTNDMYYTMSFKNVEGEAYAVRDNATGTVIAIEEGKSYEFAAQPNSTVEGRFEIVDRANVVTSIDNAQDNKANVKGIYTIMGQYVGENFDVLPTGVYVVDGVKIVK